MSLSQPSRTIVVEPVREATAPAPAPDESQPRRDDAPAAPAALEPVPAAR